MQRSLYHVSFAGHLMMRNESNQISIKISGSQQYVFSSHDVVSPWREAKVSGNRGVFKDKMIEVIETAEVSKRMVTRIPAVIDLHITIVRAKHCPWKDIAQSTWLLDWREKVPRDKGLKSLAAYVSGKNVALAENDAVRK